MPVKQVNIKNSDTMEIVGRIFVVKGKVFCEITDEEFIEYEDVIQGLARNAVGYDSMPAKQENKDKIVTVKITLDPRKDLIRIAEFVSMQFPADEIYLDITEARK